MFLFRFIRPLFFGVLWPTFSLVPPLPLGFCRPCFTALAVLSVLVPPLLLTHRLAVPLLLPPSLLLLFSASALALASSRLSPQLPLPWHWLLFASATQSTYLAAAHAGSLRLSAAFPPLRSVACVSCLLRLLLFLRPFPSSSSGSSLEWSSLLLPCTSVAHPSFWFGPLGLPVRFLCWLPPWLTFFSCFRRTPHSSGYCSCGPVLACFLCPLRSRPLPAVPAARPTPFAACRPHLPPATRPAFFYCVLWSSLWLLPLVSRGLLPVVIFAGAAHRCLPARRPHSPAASSLAYVPFALFFSRPLLVVSRVARPISSGPAVAAPWLRLPCGSSPPRYFPVRSAFPPARVPRFLPSRPPPTRHFSTHIIAVEGLLLSRPVSRTLLPLGFACRCSVVPCPVSLFSLPSACRSSFPLAFSYFSPAPFALVWGSPACGEPVLGAPSTGSCGSSCASLVSLELWALGLPFSLRGPSCPVSFILSVPLPWVYRPFAEVVEWPRFLGAAHFPCTPHRFCPVVLAVLLFGSASIMRFLVLYVPR